jgi:hypothetical protein
MGEEAYTFYLILIFLYTWRLGRNDLAGGLGDLCVMLTRCDSCGEGTRKRIWSSRVNLGVNTLTELMGLGL